MSAGRSFFFLTVAVLVGGMVMALTFAARDGLLTAFLLACLGAPVLALTHYFARRRGRAGSLSRQFFAGVGLAIGVALLGVGVASSLLFVSPHDAFTMVLLLCFAGALAAYSAWLLATAVMRDIRAVRDGVVAIATGERAPIIDTTPGDEIAELAAAAEDMGRRLAAGEAERDRADEARRRLIAAISHDLRTPLTSLQLVGKAVEDGLVLGETGRRYLEQIPSLVRSLDDLIGDLFELSRLEAGDIDWALAEVELQAVVENSVGAMHLQAQQAGVTLEARLPERLPRALGNPEKLQRVLCNLIQNALRHTPADGSVTVAARPTSEGLLLEVADTGVGVGEEDRALLFEPFFRGAGHGARSSPGAGLGLAICRALVEAHGGRIWHEDRAHGFRVCFTLPPIAGTR